MRFRPGFSLLELIVVISIIAILTSMFLPVLGNARRRAARHFCQSQIQQIGTAAAMYAHDYERPTPRSWLPSVDRNSVFLPSILDRYLGQQLKVFACPADTRDFSDRPPPNAGLSFLETEQSSYSYMPGPGVAEYEDFHASRTR